MLRIVWNGEKCNKIKKFKNFFVSIEYSWIVLFSVLFILGIEKINNTRKMRSLVSTYPKSNTGNLAGVVVVSDDDYCYELAKGAWAWLEFHYHHCWTLMNSNQVRVDETQVSDGDDWGRYILFYFILYLSFYLSTICPENAPFLNMVLS